MSSLLRQIKMCRLCNELDHEDLTYKKLSKDPPSPPKKKKKVKKRKEGMYVTCFSLKSNPLVLCSE